MTQKEQHDLEIKQAQEELNRANTAMENRWEFLTIAQTALQHVQKLITETPLAEAK